MMLLEAARFEEREVSAVAREAGGGVVTGREEIRSACKSACLSPDESSSVIPLEVPDLSAMMQTRYLMVNGVRTGHGWSGERLVLQ